jgi:hypothetical protein
MRSEQGSRKDGWSSLWPARSQKAEATRQREKKDKEEEVSSPDFVMQVLCFLEMGAGSDTTTGVGLASQGQNISGTIGLEELIEC